MDRPHDPRNPFRGRTFRVPAGLGCLFALVTVPIALIAGLLTGLLALLLPGSRRATVVTHRGRPGHPPPAPPPRSRAALGATGFALCSLVEKMSLDDDFSLEDAQMAGVPIDTEATIETLLGEAGERGWLERRGERFAVTERGRVEAGELLRRMGA